jgi:hypothetical protein
MGPSVVKVTKRGWNQSTGLLELEVLYKGNSEGFCENVDGKKLATGDRLQVTGSTSGGARLKVLEASEE